jgi:hypothetical protein
MISVHGKTSMIRDFVARRILLLIASAAGLHGAIAHAAIPVDLEVAVVRSAPLGAMQDWGKRLNELGVARVRLRGAHAGDKPTITPMGEGDAQGFRILGIINERDQLILQGGAFGIADMVRLKEFLEGLPERVAEQGVERGIFGLTKPQFEEAFRALSGIVDASSKGVTPEVAFAALTQDLKLRVEMSDEAKATLHQAKPLVTEVKGFSTGTALAMTLRAAGLAFAPIQPRGQDLRLRVMHIDPKNEYWPAGWKPDKSPNQVAPQMYRFTTVEIEGFSLAQALDALAPHMGVPLVFDERVMNARQLEPAKIQVKFPKGKTYIRRAVDHILSQGRLTGELRTDEADKPFYWITQLGPENPPPAVR